MNVAAWNALDWVLAAVLVLSVAAGFWRGLVRTVLGLAGYAGGFMLGCDWNTCRRATGCGALGWIESPVTARVLAYVLIVAVVVVCVELIAAAGASDGACGGVELLQSHAWGRVWIGARIDRGDGAADDSGGPCAAIEAGDEVGAESLFLCAGA